MPISFFFRESVNGILGSCILSIGWVEKRKGKGKKRTFDSRSRPVVDLTEPMLPMDTYEAPSYDR